MGGLRGKTGIACEEFEDDDGGILVNVSESSGVGSPRLSWIKSH